jgi:pyruvate formate lyase activating enzyme
MLLILAGRVLGGSFARWVKENMGEDTPLHFSRFFPNYRMRNPPSAPPETLDHAKQISESEGLKYVYIGKILSKRGENTY